MKWYSVIGAVVIGAGLCNPSYGFEWLDNLLGIDLDNSEAASNYGGYSTGYAPYTMGYAAPASTAGYAPYAVSYPAPVSNGCSSCARTYSGVPQTSYYGTVPQGVPVTSYQPVSTYDPFGYQVIATPPVVTYRVQPQAVPYTTNQPVYAPATNYAPAGCGCSKGN